MGIAKMPGFIGFFNCWKSSVLENVLKMLKMSVARASKNSFGISSSTIRGSH